ncbi:hypothetical protein KCU77_g11681, partial [Aureobasidium melanogenum]
MHPSEELGSPSLALSIEVLRSSSLLNDEIISWDDMSLPSSPSPKVRVPDTNMDLNRYAKRGFSEDLALPPRQIEKPFRFLDLPAEIRNMIYELTFTRIPITFGCGLLCSCHYECTHHAYKAVMKRQLRLPSIALVNKCIRQETMSLYFATTDFIWFWDPLRVFSKRGCLYLTYSIKVLADILDFATANGVQIKSITVCSPHKCHFPDYIFHDVAESVRFLAPLRRSLDLVGRVHPMLREFKFEDEDSFIRRLFDFSGSFEPLVLESYLALKWRLRLFLRADPVRVELLDKVEDYEADSWCWETEIRREKKEGTRVRNKIKGLKRWTGVLRSRSSKD